MRPYTIGCALLMGCACVAAAHAEPLKDDMVAVVAVKSIKDPAYRPYRAMSAGLDAFDQFRQLAPGAALRFRLIRPDQVDGVENGWNGTSARLAGSETSTPLPVAPDGTFALPRSAEAYADDADVIVNRRNTAVSFFPSVRTAGLPANTRRLGDLRLECEVLLAIGQKELTATQLASVTWRFAGADWCSSGRAKISSVWPDWPLGVTLVHGGGRQTLRVSGYHYYAPIQDKSLPDDTLIEFEFWGDASAERKRRHVAQWPLLLTTSTKVAVYQRPLKTGEQSIYASTVTLTRGNWEFRLASAGAQISLGTNAGAAAVAGVAHPLLWQGRKALAFKAEHSGEYEFALDLSDIDRPVATIRRAP